MLKLYNTLTRQREPFEPLYDKQVGLYTCGPTVYNYVHIGNLRTYIFEDILRRVLKYNGYKVKHVMNITDVGHLTDDADQGEDKMERGAAREGKSASAVAAFYTNAFKENLKNLNILEPNIWCQATNHITEQLAQIQILIDQGYTYETADGIYFDTTRFPDYGQLAQLNKQELKPGARVAVGEKKNPHDFALWKFTPTGQKRQMEWEAFGRKGFPGWHIECSAMSMKYLGEQFDIHCGGVDHIPVHHTNEIAQAEAATGKKPWVKYWLHGEFLLVNEGRMGKSEGNFVTLQTLKNKGFEPLAYRYYLLQTHYRQQLNFSWEALAAAAQALHNLRAHVQRIPLQAAKNPTIEAAFIEAVNDDLNLPQALALTWDAIRGGQINLETIIRFDKIFGLDLHNPEAHQPPPEVQTLLARREEARAAKNWAESDRLRAAIADLGFAVEDTEAGQKIVKRVIKK